VYVGTHGTQKKKKKVCMWMGRMRRELAGEGGAVFIHLFSEDRYIDMFVAIGLHWRERSMRVKH
jgi:hypothetical protein